MPTFSATTDRPFWTTVTPKPASTVDVVKGVALSWSGGSVPSPQSFVAWIVQRSDDTPDNYFEIAHITNQAQTTFTDYEGRRNVVCKYRVALLTDGGLSAFSAVRTATPPAYCGLTFTSNAQPNLNMARQDIGDREVDWVDEPRSQVWSLYGRDNVVVFRGLEDRGDTMRVKLQLHTVQSPPNWKGVEAWEPVRRLVHAETPYVCVLDEDGSRWFAAISSDGGGSFTNNAQTWIASLTVQQVASVPYSVSA